MLASDAQRVRNALLAQWGSNPEVAHRVAYFNLAERLGQLGTGELPVPADSTLLVDLANASTAYAPVACATLRYYYPEISCGDESTSASTAARPAAASPIVHQVGKVGLRAYPNPATETVTLIVSGPVSVEARLELVALATGRVVRTLPADTAGGPMTVSGLAAGVYAGRLVQAEQVLGTCKVVIIH